MIIEGYFFLFLMETICSDPLSELSQQDNSDEGSQHMFYAESTKLIPTCHQILPLSRALGEMPCLKPKNFWTLKTRVNSSLKE